MNDHTTLTLQTLGAIHSAETVIALLTGGARALSRDALASAVSDAAVTAAALSRALDQLAGEIERQRVAEYEAAYAARIVRFPLHHNVNQGAF